MVFPTLFFLQDLGGCFEYFYFFYSGEGKGESEAPGRGGVVFSIENPTRGGGVFPGGGGAGRVSAANWGIWGGWAKIFFFGPETSTKRLFT